MSWASESIPAQLQRLANQQPDAPALVAPNLSLSYRELWQAVRELANQLTGAGLRRLGLCGDNTPAWVVADLACLLAEVVCVPVPGFFSASQTAHLIDTAGLEGLLWPVTNGSGAGYRLTEHAWLQPLAVAGAQAPLPEGTAKITFTSGSTGRPKGVCLSAQQLANTTQALKRRLAGLQLSQHACVLPLATLLENIAGVYLPLSLGATVQLTPLPALGMSGSSGLEPERLITQLQALWPDSLILVPELASILVAAAAKGALRDHRFRFLAVGGGKVSPLLLDRGRSLGLPLYEGYGLSECGSVVALSVPDGERPGSVGMPLDHLQVHVLDDREIRVSGQVHLGYLGDSPKTDGFSDTGDLGYLDDEGYLYVNGRKKNLLITSFGRNISPEWLESELTLATGVRQALVFGDGEPGPSALIILPDSETPRLRQALAELNQRLPDYARLRTVYLRQQPLEPARDYLTANGRWLRPRVLSDLGLILETAQPLVLLQAQHQNSPVTGTPS